jgi:hypothetical protein
MRSDGVRRAEAGSSTHDAHAVSMHSDARMMLRCQRSRRLVFLMQFAASPVLYRLCFVAVQLVLLED